MKVIIAGSRGLYNFRHVAKAVRLSGFLPEMSTVISGAAEGIDTLGEIWADALGIPVEKFPADWSTHGRSAGYVRNRQMVDYVRLCPEGGGLIAVWDGSSGTENTIQVALKFRVRTFVLYVGAWTSGPNFFLTNPEVGFQQCFMPDLHRSATSKRAFREYNKLRSHYQQ